MNKKLSIIIPIYNEASNIDEVILRLGSIKKDLNNYDVEYIFIDDGSKDDSIKILQKYSEANKDIKIISLSRNFGQQIAYKCGYDNSDSDLVITMDGDLQDPPELVLEMINKIEQGFDIVYARRIKRHENLFKKITANLYYKILYKFSDIKIPKNVGDFRIITKKVLEEIKKINQRNIYIRGMIASMGFKYEFLNFERENRKAGKTKYNTKKMIKLGLDGIINYTDIPLKIIKWIAILSFSIGFFGFIFMAYLDLFKDKYFPTWTYIIVFLFIFNSINFSIFWLLGQYLRRILEEKNIQNYIIDKKINF